MSKSGGTQDLYKEAGVDVAKGDRLVDWLRAGEGSEAQKRGQIVSGIGGFAGLFRPDFSGIWPTVPTC